MMFFSRASLKQGGAAEHEYLALLGAKPRKPRRHQRRLRRLQELSGFGDDKTMLFEAQPALFGLDISSCFGGMLKALAPVSASSSCVDIKAKNDDSDSDEMSATASTMTPRSSWSGERQIS
eukprot:TRINITY_DN102085_c0_g1_i1.p1 TRINITY_DN102085_c0_g1~~TRINITY_DN102085_c0_g1_i1.p1  ORF type:complete len:121 (-),score=27.85 TRINITY_DN102085_c0_g1_i1:239-601(-)